VKAILRVSRRLTIALLLSPLLAGVAGGGGTIQALSDPDQKDAEPASGIFDVRAFDGATGLTQCPQAGLKARPPQPLGAGPMDRVEEVSSGGSNVRLNQDYSCFPQDETSIAVNPTNPRNVIGGANDYRLAWGSSGFYATTDTGAHWYDGIRPFPSPINGDDHVGGGGDPALAFDRAGMAYYADIHFDRTTDTSGVFVSRSTNGGFTWSRPCIPFGSTDATARCGGNGDPRRPGDGVVSFDLDNDTVVNQSVPSNDKEYIATGPRPAGVTPVCFAPKSKAAIPAGALGCPPEIIGVDRIYVTWTLFVPLTPGNPASPDTSEIHLSYSDDQGRSWSPRKPISGNAAFCIGFPSRDNKCNSNQYSVPTVSPATGALYVSFENFNTPNEDQYVVVRSRDGGTTIEGPYFVTPVFDINYPRSGATLGRRADCAARGQQNGRRVLSNSCFRLNAGGNVVVDKRGGAFANDLYLVMSDNRNGTRASTNTDIFLFKSTDGGSTWAGPTRVNDDPSAQPVTGSPAQSNRNCALTDPNCQGSFGNDQWYPWVDISSSGVVTVGFEDRRLDTTSTAGEWPSSRTAPNGRAGNYLVWFWGAQCQVAVANSSECVAPTAGVTPPPVAPINPGNVLFQEQTAFPFHNFQLSNVPSNWDYTFRAGIFAGDYSGVAAGPDNVFWAMWTDARNGRSSRTQSGRNPACEQSDVFAQRFTTGSDQQDPVDITPFLSTPCPTSGLDQGNVEQPGG
jgi:hypothetical protein